MNKAEGATVCRRCHRLERDSLVYDVKDVGSVCVHCLEATDTHELNTVSFEDRFENLQKSVGKTLEILHSSLKLSLHITEDDGKIDVAKLLEQKDDSRKWKIRQAIETLEGVA